MKRIAVIAHAGKSLGGGLPELRERLVAEGCEDLLWYEVEKSRQAPKRVRRAIDEGASLLLVWGGDGIVQRSLDALPAHEPPPLAILPAGTANLFANNLGMPIDLEGALEVALHGADRRLDVGRINGERFGVMAGAGFDARMIAEADKGMKDRVGRVAYAWTGLRATRAGRQQMTVRVDGERWFKGKASCVLVGNLGTITGGISAFDDAASGRRPAGGRRRHRGGAVAVGAGPDPHGRRPVGQVGAREHDERPPGRRPARSARPPTSSTAVTARPPAA